MPNDDEITIEGMLRQIIAEHDDEDIDGVLVLILKGESASVYNSNIKPEIVEAIGALLGPQN